MPSNAQPDEGLTPEIVARATQAFIAARDRGATDSELILVTLEAAASRRDQPDTTAICECGHLLAQHSAENRWECSEECSCEAFKARAAALSVAAEPKEGAPPPLAPESMCERCKGPNVVWFAPNDLWNRVAPELGILCPICFIREAESKGIVPTGWMLTEEVAADAPPTREPEWVLYRLPREVAGPNTPDWQVCTPAWAAKFPPDVFETVGVVRAAAPRPEPDHE